MFCYQCEQTVKGIGCEVRGVCGKTPEVASLQDLLLYSLMSLSTVRLEGNKLGIKTNDEIDSFLIKAMFSTLTNVNFNENSLACFISNSIKHRDKLINEITMAGGNIDKKDALLSFVPAKTIEDLVKQGEKVGLKSYPADNEDVLSLKHTILFGLKGVCAYADHAQLLGKKDSLVFDYVYKALSTIQKDSLSVEALIKITLECGKVAFRAMEMLDDGNTSTYGHPIPTKVSRGYIKGKAILVSGHDLLDLEELLKQSSGKGINIYTHGEMLSSHGYPEFKKYPHFYGHYGSAWQNQIKEFPNFPGSILMTTNCIQRPKNSYKENIFTSGVVSWPGVVHISDRNFAPVINKALDLPGFKETISLKKELTVGFARNAVLSIADKILEGIKDGAIKHIFLIGGCDGIKSERSYYRDFVQKVPKDCLIMTLACGKYKFNDLDLGYIGDLPRLIDLGQCNDAYSAVIIALELSKATKLGVNDLPLSLVLSWYEQKAVCILLALFDLGIKDIRLGPTLPAFISSGVLRTLVDNFNVIPISTPDEDIKAILE